MLTQTLKTLFHRELNKLKQEIELYKEENKLWIIDKAIANSGGNLCLHLIGNLNTYIGKELGGTDYIRNRDLEFSQRDIPQAELLKKIDETILVAEKALDTVNQSAIGGRIPRSCFC